MEGALWDRPPCHGLELNHTALSLYILPLDCLKLVMVGPLEGTAGHFLSKAGTITLTLCPGVYIPEEWWLCSPVCITLEKTKIMEGLKLGHFYETHR